MIQLSRATLSRLPRDIAPGYDPASLSPGIVHLGLGGFHRAHMARYTNELFARDPASRDWAIIGAGLLPADRRMHEALAPQDSLYTLVEREDAAETIRVIASLAGTLWSAEDPGPLLAAIDAARIVSLTVTEHGYCLNRATRRLDPAHPQIVADLANPLAPHGAIGIIVESCRRRMASGRPAFTALSCDNIQHNGRVLRDAVLDLAGLRDPALAAWIAANARFPNTMVDRITPVTTRADIDALAATHGIADRWPVVCERFTQWVIEDDFAAGRPAWERVGAQFVPDVAPYEFMKLRLLNASHLAIAGLGRLAGAATIDETMRLPNMRAYMSALMATETGPTIPPVPGIDLAAYQRTLLSRFANRAIRDTTDRVNTDAPLNVLLDPIRDRLAANQPIPLLALALAAWIRRVRGTDEQGAPIPIHHPIADELRTRACAGGSDPGPVLGITALFGDLGQAPALVSAVGTWLHALDTRGSLHTLESLALPEIPLATGGSNG